MAIEKDAVTTVPTPYNKMIRKSAAALGHRAAFFLCSLFYGYDDGRKKHHEYIDEYHQYDYMSHSDHLPF